MVAMPCAEMAPPAAIDGRTAALPPRCDGGPPFDAGTLAALRATFWRFRRGGIPLPAERGVIAIVGGRQ